MFMGDGCLVFREKIEEVLGDRAFFAPKTVAMNLGGSVAELGAIKYKEEGGIHYSKLVPSYVRLSQAERDLLLKKKNV